MTERQISDLMEATVIEELQMFQKLAAAALETERHILEIRLKKKLEKMKNWPPSDDLFHLYFWGCP